MSEETLQYNTIKPCKSTYLYKEKGSKFIAYIFPIDSEEEAQKQLDYIKSQHPQARHVCYAYTYGLDPKTFRINDDGEPSNSAGAPIYNQILSSNLDFVLIAVVRYFGGTKLGVSGLINAYKTAAKEIIDIARIITVERQFLLKITCRYDQLSSVYHYLNTHENKIQDQKQELECEIWVEFPLKNKEETVQFFNEQAYGVEILNS